MKMTGLGHMFGLSWKMNWDVDEMAESKGRRRSNSDTGGPGGKKNPGKDTAKAFEGEIYEEALKLYQNVRRITDRGNDAEVRRKQDGALHVYEVKKSEF